MALAEIVDGIAAQLVHVAPMVKSAKELARFTTLPRYVWVRTAVAPSTRKHSDAGSLQEDAYENAIHCEAKSEADAEAMRRALIQAARLVVKGGNYREGRSEWIEPDDVQNGTFALVVPMTIFVQLPKATLPASPVPGGTPNTVVTTDKPAEVQVDTVEIDPSGAVSGDGELQGGET